MSVEFQMFFYILAAVMVFQGLHLFGEAGEPLGTLPEEVGQAKAPSHRWGGFLMAYGALMVLFGALSYRVDFFGPTLLPLRNLGFLVLGVYAFWVIFMGRTVEFIGKPALDDHDHGHAHH